MSRARIDLRSEDLLTLVFSTALVAMVGIRSAVVRLVPDEAAFWDLSFVLLPLALLVFAASVRYAFDLSAGPAALRRIVAVFRDWLPFLLFSLAYESFRASIWTRVLPRDQDAALRHLDEALFGASPSFLLQSWTRPFVTDVLSSVYFLHVVLPPVLALALYRNDRALFRPFLLSVLLCGMLGSIGYLMVPATGPAIAFREEFHVPLSGVLHEPFTQILDAARAPRDAFPSLHAAISAVVLYFAWRYGRRTFLVALPLVAGIWFSTIYLRYHYVVDVIAGGLLAVVVVVLSDALLRLERLWRSPGASAVSSEPEPGVVPTPGSAPRPPPGI